MVVNKADKGDITLGTGRLRAAGQTFKVTVYGDSVTGAATVFPPDALTEGGQRIPEQATVVVTDAEDAIEAIEGRRFTAQQEFRFGAAAGALPVYGFDAARFIQGQQQGEDMTNTHKSGLDVGAAFEAANMLEPGTSHRDRDDRDGGIGLF